MRLVVYCHPIFLWWSSDISMSVVVAHNTTNTTQAIIIWSKMIDELSIRRRTMILLPKFSHKPKRSISVSLSEGRLVIFLDYFCLLCVAAEECAVELPVRPRGSFDERGELLLCLVICEGATVVYCVLTYWAAAAALFIYLALRKLDTMPVCCDEHCFLDRFRALVPLLLPIFMTLGPPSCANLGFLA